MNLGQLKNGIQSEGENYMKTEYFLTEENIKIWLLKAVAYVYQYFFTYIMAPKTGLSSHVELNII